MSAHRAPSRTRSWTSGAGTPARRRTAAAVSLAVATALTLPLLSPAPSAAAPVGNGFTVTASDIAFILKQVKVAERHAATLTPADRCGTLVGPAADQVPDRLTAYGLRTVDGSCNNLFAGRETTAAADQLFPRLATPTFRTADPTPAGLPPGNATPTTYADLTGLVYDAQPRTASNLIVDQTSTNPAAIAAAGLPVRSQANPGRFPCTTDPDPTANPPVDAAPAGCVPSHQTLFIPNVTTDVGLSPPYNSLFTFFGQFFDHGVDQTVKTGGTVFVPLKADDPLRLLGPDGKAGTGDEVPASQAFMVLTRSTKDFPGPDGVLGTADDVRSAVNTDSPWVDQSQTYTSHASHQVFLREYAPDAAGRPVSTGRLLGGLAAGQTYAGSPDGRDGISTWASTKDQAARLLGLRLVDTDVTNIPLLATDPYGNFLPGPARGLPQYVTTTGLVEGDTAAGGLPVPGNALHFDTPFLTDIAHNADPSPVDTNNDGVPDTALRPDADGTPSADFAHQPAGTYDDEMLDAHFTCGDGRCNENIALSSIHQVFHSEHDRLVGDIQTTLDDPANAALKADFLAAHPFGASGADISFGTGGRLFQAARFVTEMEYQHLVFEEFARKLVPGVRPFHVYTPDTDPAIAAEFAHAVYRFGHSMLDDDVARSGPDTNPNGTLVDHSIPLLTAFLNPPKYFDGGSAGTLTPAQAAGAIVMGSSDQVGNELDEFVTETLRNNLLGLPLDLPTLNMARAREAGVPRLNGLRRQVFARTNDGQLAPYTDWSDFGNHLKHPESLINFVAAYGTHPTVLAATTLKAKRDAARAIVDPQPLRTGPDLVFGTADDVPADVPPADAADFMFSNDAWVNVNGVTVTGLDDVDLWVGGLAEVTNLFGSLVGSTFNYVFQSQLEALQDGDRFYYLGRTPGLNLRTQLEGNSFSELIGRNTEGTNSLKADAFATADCRFQLANDAGTPAGFTASGSVVADDPSTGCDESLLLQRSPDGTLSYRQRNTVDVPGINGQSVYNGSGTGDRVKGGNDNDTFWGGPGKDVIDGQGGDDIALGGDGNDILTDSDGADVPKGGPGNDAIDAGPGDDIVLGGDGQDVTNGGANDNETFAGPGNDFVIAGQGADAVFGDGGDDWIQGGTGQDLLQGDHGAPFFDDPAQVKPGNDVFVGQVGENDYDAEGGDDVMSQNSFVDRNAGAGGFDWAIHQYNTVPADDDMQINQQLVGVPIQLVVNRDRWQETEAVSGAGFDDVIRGDDNVPADLGGAGFSGCDALDAAGVARIAGLSTLVTPAMLTRAPGPIAAASAAGACPLTGNVWGAGNILTGGLGSDTLTGRGGDDVLDGDRYVTVAISVRTDPADPASETGRTDLVEGLAAAGGTFGPGTAGMTLQQAVFAGLVDPGNLVAVRQLVTPPAPAGDCAAAAPANCDTAVFAGPASNYLVTTDLSGVTTVTQTGGNVVGQKISDGIDTLRNVERAQFSDRVVPLVTAAATAPGAPTIGTATAGIASATVTWTAPATDGGSPVTGFRIDALTGTTVVSTTSAPAAATSAVVPGLTVGTAYTFRVRAVNAVGESASSAASNAVTAAAAATVPAAPVVGVATALNASANVTWARPADGGSAITGFQVDVLRLGVVTGAVRTAGPAAGNLVVTGLTNGLAYTFRVRAVNAVGVSASSAPSNAVTPATVPTAPRIGAATSGAAGGAVTATATWAAPLANGGTPVTGYRVIALRMSSGAAGATVLGETTSALLAPTVRSLAIVLPVTGTYRFQVVALNAVGTSARSARSGAVLGR